MFQALLGRNFSRPAPRAAVEPGFGRFDTTVRVAYGKTLPREALVSVLAFLSWCHSARKHHLRRSFRPQWTAAARQLTNTTRISALLDVFDAGDEGCYFCCCLA